MMKQYRISTIPNITVAKKNPKQHFMKNIEIVSPLSFASIKYFIDDFPISMINSINY